VPDPSPDPPELAFHDWTVEEREIRRHVARRGRQHAFGSLDPRRTALVVIDMVPFFVRESAYCRGIVPHINALADKLRRSGGVVVWVVPGHREPTAKDRELLGSEIAEIFAHSGGDGALWHDLAVADDDPVVAKTAHSAFFPGRSHLPDLLAERGIDTVVVTGTVTNVCVEGSVRDASTMGYRVILVADGCAAVRDQDHNAALHVVYRSFGDVRPTSEVLELIESGVATSGVATRQ